MRSWMHAWPAQKSVLIEVGQRRAMSIAEADGVEGVGELQSSEDAGEPKATGPGRAKAARVGMGFRRET